MFLRNVSVRLPRNTDSYLEERNPRLQRYENFETRKKYTAVTNNSEGATDKVNIQRVSDTQFRITANHANFVKPTQFH